MAMALRVLGAAAAGVQPRQKVVRMPGEARCGDPLRDGERLRQALFGLVGAFEVEQRSPGGDERARFELGRAMPGRSLELAPGQRQGAIRGAALRLDARA